MGEGGQGDSVGDPGDDAHRVASQWHAADLLEALDVLFAGAEVNGSGGQIGVDGVAGDTGETGQLGNVAGAGAPSAGHGVGAVVAEPFPALGPGDELGQGGDACGFVRFGHSDDTMSTDSTCRVSRHTARVPRPRGSARSTAGAQRAMCGTGPRDRL